MIRCIAAIDNARGIANDSGIPWQGKIPSDVRWYLDKIQGKAVLMGYSTFQEYKTKLPGGINYVATRSQKPMRLGAERVSDIYSFIENYQGDLWIIGGAAVFDQTIPLADELYITQLEGNHGCTKFFPPYEVMFTLRESSKMYSEGGIQFRFEVWAKSDSTGS